MALGEDVVGAMSNNQPWCDKVLAAAKSAGEDMWQLPMFDHYAKLIDSDVADIKNTGGRWGGPSARPNSWNGSSRKSRGCISISPAPRSHRATSRIAKEAELAAWFAR